MKLPTQKYAQDLRKYYRQPSVRVSLTLVLSIFVVAVFVAFALRPTIISIVNLRKTIVDSKKTLQELDSKVSNLQKAAIQLDAIKPFLGAINSSIPNKGAMYSPLTLALENLALQTGVLLESDSLGGTLLFSRILTPYTPSKNQSVVSLPFNVRATGSYPNLITFMTRLLSMERIMKIESMTVTKEAGSKSASAAVVLNITGSTYYLADEVQLQKSMAELKGKE